MILNKKGLAVLPLVALLFTSCNSWKSVDYNAAKKFIDTNYKLDGALTKLPKKVHEKFNGTANNDEMSIAMLKFCTSEIFYTSSVPGTQIDWAKGSPYTYEGDYNPSKDVGDYGISPIKSEYDILVNVDSLIPEDKEKYRTCVYETNGKKFKQTANVKQDIDNNNFSHTTEWRSYDEKGYRVEVYAKGEFKMKDESVDISYNYEYRAIYTYEN